MARRYLPLDAMRGIAAIVVVIYHSAIITDAGCTQATCNVRFGYLAVDMFFLLSGFVLSHGYDRRFADGMTATAFMKARMVRLMPLYALAFLAGLPAAGLDVAKGAMSVPTLFGSAAFNAAILPWHGDSPAAYAIAIVRPAWSLFFELWVANLVFALFWRQLRGINLAMVIGLSLAGVVIGIRSYGSLDMGPIWATLPGGFPRVLFSFFLGVALRRGIERRAVPALPPVLTAGAMAAIFFVPVATAWRPMFELGCIAIAFPAIVLLGAGATLRIERPARLLGDASYALYLLHMPLLDWWLKGMHRLHVTPQPIAAAGFVASALAAALVIDRLYDRRMRTALDAWLGARTPARAQALPDLSAGAMAAAASMP